MIPDGFIVLSPFALTLVHRKALAPMMMGKRHDDIESG